MQEIILEIQFKLAEAVKKGNKKAEKDLLELKRFSELVIEVEEGLFGIKGRLPSYA